MFRITEGPSSGSLVQWLAKNYKNDSIVSVDMDKVGVMVEYSDPLCVCVVHCMWADTFMSSLLRDDEMSAYLTWNELWISQLRQRTVR